MKIVLSPGDNLTVCFEQTDGEIVIAYGETHLTVSADLPDTTGRQGVIYEEIFGPSQEEEWDGTGDG